MLESFSSRLSKAIQRTRGCLCLGLDAEISKLPSGFPKDFSGIRKFYKSIIESTLSQVVAYKPNIAFFEILGKAGWELLEEIRTWIPSEILLILDVKRGDIGNTSRLYAETYFGNIKADGVTVSPYLGRDAVLPFLAYANTCTFILCLTSNASAADFQLAELKSGEKIYENVAKYSLEWEQPGAGELGWVIGATQSQFLKSIRRISDKVTLLIPGIGAQGGDLKEVLEFGRNNNGDGILVNVSRSILYASGGTDYLLKSNEEILKILSQMRSFF
jgi:orotidine-5'-phosphate decarboxylase